MTHEDLWELAEGDSPVIATAIHDGHELRPEVEAVIALDDAARLLEEDPHTGRFTEIVPTRIVARRSRFEVDLNRPRHLAVYRTPEHAWGQQVWAQEPAADLVERSLAQYDAFYALAERVIATAVERHGAAVVLDLHSYNHRRGGPHAPPEDPQANPEVNVGTGSLDRPRWGHLVERFVADLARQDVQGAKLDVRENVRFTGGHFSDWVDTRFAGAGCCLAVEVKKTFMDEHSGAVDVLRLEAVREALAATIPGLVEELHR